MEQKYFSRNARASRLHAPESYGLKDNASEQDLIPLAHIEERLQTARNYWIGSTRTDGRPHATPVWGIWLDGTFYFSTDPKSRKGRNLAANPEIVVHLESGDDVVILEGRVVQENDPEILKTADAAYFQKYQFHLVNSVEYPGIVYRLRPRDAFAWLENSYPDRATRWEFQPES